MNICGSTGYTYSIAKLRSLEACVRVNSSLASALEVFLEDNPRMTAFELAGVWLRFAEKFSKGLTTDEIVAAAETLNQITPKDSE